MSFDPEEILGAPLAETDPARFLVAADDFETRGLPRLAASALDRAYALAPDDEHLQSRRTALLDELAITEHGLVFRYVPAGTFQMGAVRGDPDERPVHAVRLGEYWMADVPMTWAAYCQLLGWSAPPDGFPIEDVEGLIPGDAAGERLPAGFILREGNKIRRQYCETETTRALDHHVHGGGWGPQSPFRAPPRAHPDRAPSYDCKPMVGVTMAEVAHLVARLATPDAKVLLPTEAEWEKAARGGLLGKRWSWGDEWPTPTRCDFDRYGDFRLTDPRERPANGYGLHGMCGGVWEWTRSTYDALAYHRRAASSVVVVDPLDAAPEDVPGAVPVLRGGSWSDCATSVTTSFRMARRERESSPNIGFRLVRQEHLTST